MSKFSFGDYLKDKNIKMTDEDKLYCLSVINENIIILKSRASNKSWLNGLIIDYKLWVKDKQISDLEAKLAESEEIIKTRIATYEKQHIEQIDEIYQLKQQLAMQEHTITTLIEDNRASQEWYKKQLEEKDDEIKDLNYRLDLKFVNYTNSESIKFLEDQDKIKFSIAELEKAKIEFETYYADNIWNYPQYLEDRIKLLKEEK